LPVRVSSIPARNNQPLELNTKNAPLVGAFFYVNRSRLSHPIDDVCLYVIRMHVFLGYHSTAYPNTGSHNSVPIPRNQRMPFRQALAFVETTIGTGIGQIWIIAYCFCSEHETLGYPFFSVWIVSAPARFGIQQLAGQIGVMDVTGIGVLQLYKAAAGASITERLPLIVTELAELFRLPEFLIHSHTLFADDLDLDLDSLERGHRSPPFGYEFFFDTTYMVR
jgi:hypothetical protein